MPFTKHKDTLQGLKEQNHSTDKITVGVREISLNIRQEVLRKTLKDKNRSHFQYILFLIRFASAVKVKFNFSLNSAIRTECTMN